MARKLIKKDVTARIKANKAVLVETKKAIAEGMKKLVAGEEVDARCTTCSTSYVH